MIGKGIKQEFEKKKSKWFAGVCLLVGLLYFMLMIGVTIYSQTIYIHRLPAVQLKKPKPSKISYTLKEDAVISEGGATIELDLSDRVFPMQSLQPNCMAKLKFGGETYSGKLAQIEECSDYLYLLTLDINTKNLDIGTKAEAEITCVPMSFSTTIERSLVYQDTHGNDVIYLIEQQEGAWGKKYVLKEQEIFFWPEEGSEIVALMLATELSSPIAKPIDQGLLLYTGMEIQLTL